jgi:urease beta subunit
MSIQGNFSYKAAACIAVAMSLCLPAAFAAERSFDRTLSVNGPVTLHVSTGAGNIRVSPGSDNQVHIVGHVKGRRCVPGCRSSPD